MKKITSILVIICIVFAIGLSGCADNQEFNGKEYKTYGLIDKDDVKDPNIKYELAWGNIIWSVILIETISAPIYFFGFSLWEPVAVIDKK